MELDSYGTYMGQSVETKEGAQKAWRSLVEWGTNGYCWTGREDYDNGAPQLINSLKSARETDDLVRTCVALVGGLVAMASPVLVGEGWLTRRTVTVLSGTGLIGAYALYRTTSAVWATEAEIVKRIESHMDLVLSLADKQPFGVDYKKIYSNDAEELDSEIWRVLSPLVEKCAPKNTALLKKVENLHKKICESLDPQTKSGESSDLQTKSTYEGVD